MNIIKSKYFIITSIYIIYSIYYLITRDSFTYKIIESTAIYFTSIIVFMLYDKYYKNDV